MSRKAAEERLGIKPLPPEAPRVITVSRQLGSGGRIVAEILSRRLGWSLWDRELVDAIAENTALARSLVERFDEKTVSDIEALVRSAMGEPELGGFMYKRQLTRVVFSIAKHGAAVILGRGANFLLPKALNVRIEAAEETRIANMIRVEGLTHPEAVERIHLSDRERAAFTRKVFDRDIGDCRSYDIVIQADCFTPAQAAEVILAAAGIRFPELAMEPLKP